MQEIARSLVFDYNSRKPAAEPLAECLEHYGTRAGSHHLTPVLGRRANLALRFIMKKKGTAVRMATFLSVALMITGISFHASSSQLRNKALIIKHFSQGQQAMATQQYAQAAREFEEVLKLDPSLSQARINLGLAYHLLGDYARAAAELEKGLEHNPNILGANVILGTDELKLGHASTAIPPLKRALSIDPSNQRALKILATAYAAVGNYRNANLEYRAAFDKGPKDAEGWLGLGKAYLSMAKQLGARMAHNYPASSWLDRLAGDVLAERERWSDAAAKYKSAIVQDPHQKGLHSSLGKALLMQGKFEDAEKELQAELQFDPHDPSARLGIAEIELGQGQIGAALAAVQQVAEGSPGFLAGPSDFPAIKIPPPLAARMVSELTGAQPKAGLHYLLSALYTINGQTSLARQQRAAFQLTLKQLSGRRTNPPSTSAACRTHQYEACERLLRGRKHLDASQYEALGHAHFALQDYGKASDAFASALALRNSEPALTYWLLRSYIQLANNCFVELTNHYPDSPQAHELQADYYKMTGADTKAVQEYEAALKKDPHNASLYMALGEIALKQHDLLAAGHYAQQALAFDPSSPRSLCLMGRVAIGTAHPDEAISYLKKALQYDPNYLPARASLGIAYLHSGNAAAAVEELKQSASLDIYGDLHYMLYRAYQQLGKQDLAKNALAVSQALRRKTAAAALAKLGSLGGSQ
jgi:tetratricopeptide (TPR) repeat protein